MALGAVAIARSAQDSLRRPLVACRLHVRCLQGQGLSNGRRSTLNGISWSMLRTVQQEEARMTRLVDEWRRFQDISRQPTTSRRLRSWRTSCKSHQDGQSRGSTGQSLMVRGALLS
eukprot:symbB.v1.2.004144.t1/scaffold235.1/size321457/3